MFIFIVKYAVLTCVSITLNVTSKIVKRPPILDRSTERGTFVDTLILLRLKSLIMVQCLPICSTTFNIYMRKGFLNKSTKISPSLNYNFPWNPLTLKLPKNRNMYKRGTPRGYRLTTSVAKLLGVYKCFVGPTLHLPPEKPKRNKIT